MFTLLLFKLPLELTLNSLALLLLKLLGDKDQTKTLNERTTGHSLIKRHSPRLIYINSLIHILINSQLAYSQVVRKRYHKYLTLTTCFFRYTKGFSCTFFLVHIRGVWNLPYFLFIFYNVWITCCSVSSTFKLRSKF